MPAVAVLSLSLACWCRIYHDLAQAPDDRIAGRGHRLERTIATFVDGAAHLSVLTLASTEARASEFTFLSARPNTTILGSEGV
jgi:hypothetical protein